MYLFPPRKVDREIMTVKRRAVLLLIVMAAALVLASSGVALAKIVSCTKDPCLGTKKADRIFGTANSETIKGLGGDDDIEGRDGNDTIYGGGGSDHRLASMGGQDLVLGGPGNDFIDSLFGDSLDGLDDSYGNDGNDTIKGGIGTDRIFGGRGDDRISDPVGPATNGPADHDYVDGGPGTNDIDVFDGDDLDTVCNGSFPVRADPGDSVTIGPCPT